MPDRPHEFDIKDAQGVPHHYVMGYHGFEDGADVSLWLIANCGSMVGTMLPALKQATSSLMQEAGTVEALLSMDAGRAFEGLADALGSVPPEAFAAELRRSLAGAKPMLRVIFKHAARDGLPVLANLDTIYRANFWEMYQAAFEIIKANRFFPLPSTFSLASR